MKNITIIGTGYVGLVTGACLAEFGNQVICQDIDASKIRRLKAGKVPFYEPDLEKLLGKNIAADRLKFTLNLDQALGKAQFVFICVGTPPKQGGSADLRAYFKVVKDIGRFLRKHSNTRAGNSSGRCYQPLIIINKSTVPIGTARNAHQIIKKTATLPAKLTGSSQFAIVSNPEFLREGRAVEDFMNPERIVLGIDKSQKSKVKSQKCKAKIKNIHNRAHQALIDLYKPFDCPKLITNWETAEMIKYASNAYLATKISFINEIANVCDKIGADVKKVAKGMGYDSRIGNKFLHAGIGYGGSCFPKDIRALHHMALHQNYNFQLLSSVIEVNNKQRMLAIKKIRAALQYRLKNKTIAVLGLAFKPKTDDTRESASIFIIKKLIKAGAKVKAYDPEAGKNARKDLADVPGVKITSTAITAIKNCDLVFLATEWEKFLSLDWKKIKKLMKGNVVIDGRNALEQAKIKKTGLKYIGFGVH